MDNLKKLELKHANETIILNAILYGQQLDDAIQYLPEIVRQIDDYDMLIKIVTIGKDNIQKRYFTNYTTDNELIIAAFDKILQSEQAVTDLLLCSLSGYTLKELSFITTGIVNKHPKLLPILCDDFVIRNYYRDFNMTKDIEEILESIIVLNTIIDKSV